MIKTERRDIIRKKDIQQIFITRKPILKHTLPVKSEISKCTCTLAVWLEPLLCAKLYLRRFQAASHLQKNKSDVTKLLTCVKKSWLFPFLVTLWYFIVLRRPNGWLGACQVYKRLWTVLVSPHTFILCVIRWFTRGLQPFLGVGDGGTKEGYVYSSFLFLISFI